MTDKEHAALSWLDDAARTNGYCPSLAVSDRARTLKSMLAAPRMPKEPTPEIVKALQDNWAGACLGGASPYAAHEGAYRTIYAHLIKNPAVSEPRLPSPTDHAAIDALAQRAPTIPRQWIAEIIRIMHEPPAPPMKEIEVEQWAIYGGDGTVWGCHRTEESAQEAGKRLGRNWGFHTVVRLTGKVMVPVIEVAPAADGCRGRTLAERRA